MRLDRLLGDVDVLEVRGEPASVEVRAIAHDTAAVRPDTLFCCLRGARADGHDFAPQAIDAGAVALLCERFVDVDAAVAQARVTDARAAMGPIAAAFYDNPSSSLRVVGITGTNGKTTVAHLLGAVFDAHGWPAAVIGTLTGTRTTPEAPALQESLARFRDEGAVGVAMEVSSHALVQHRVDGVRFAAAVFTNLSQDHLDYHGTMEDYFAAKAQLFEPGRADLAVINADDGYGRRLLEAARVPAVRYSLADAAGLGLGPDGASFQWEGEAVRLQLRGRFNVMNALAAASAARELGIPASDIAAGLGSVTAVPGRFETIDGGQAFTVVVDYAHTPDGLEQALTAGRELAAGGRVIVVFGAGGDRDHAKRPLMGEAATRLADLAILTSDNPRSEDPYAIIEEVRAGAHPDRLIVDPDRASAIQAAVTMAKPGDVVVIAGKGHESGQEINGVVHPFDDRAAALDALGRRP